jgi:hypothetical protein
MQPVAHAAKPHPKRLTAVPDLDLSTVGDERTGARQQTGTMEFMAIDVLRGVEHTYRHDLESFFYVLLWICARRAWERRGSLQLETPT